MNIKSLLDGYMSRFKVYNPDTLFEPDWSLLIHTRCPLCGNRLKTLRNKKFSICSGKKHGKSFIISAKRLAEIQFTLKQYALLRKL